MKVQMNLFQISNLLKIKKPLYKMNNINNHIKLLPTNLLPMKAGQKVPVVVSDYSYTIIIVTCLC